MKQGSQQVSSVEKGGSCMQLQQKSGVFFKNLSIVDLQCYISFRYTTQLFNGFTHLKLL